MPNRAQFRDIFTVADDRIESGHETSNDPYVVGHGAARTHETLQAAFKFCGKRFRGEERQLFLDGYAAGVEEKGLVRK